LDASWRPDHSNIFINMMPYPPRDLCDVLPKARPCYSFIVTGELSAKHLTGLAILTAGLVEQDMPAILIATAPAEYMRQALPLNPLLKPHMNKGNAAFIEAFSRVLCSSVDMPTIKVAYG
jgi:hypothetical protein